MRKGRRAGRALLGAEFLLLALFCRFGTPFSIGVSSDSLPSLTFVSTVASSRV